MLSKIFLSKCHNQTKLLRVVSVDLDQPIRQWSDILYSLDDAEKRLVTCILWNTPTFPMCSPRHIIGGDVTELLRWKLRFKGIVDLWHSYSKQLTNAANVSKATMSSHVITEIMLYEVNQCCKPSITCFHCSRNNLHFHCCINVSTMPSFTLLQQRILTIIWVRAVTKMHPNNGPDSHGCSNALLQHPRVVMFV